FNEIAFLISSSLYIRISIPPLVITSFYLYYIFFCLFRQLRKCMKFFVYFYPNCINKVDIKNISLFCRFKSLIFLYMLIFSLFYISLYFLYYRILIHINIKKISTFNAYLFVTRPVNIT